MWAAGRACSHRCHQLRSSILDSMAATWSLSAAYCTSVIASIVFQRRAMSAAMDRIKRAWRSVRVRLENEEGLE